MTTFHKTPENSEDPMYHVWIDNFPDNKTQTIEQTHEWINNLRQSAIDSHISTAWIRSDLMLQQTWLQYENDLHSFEWFSTTLNRLLEEIKNTRKW